eukprot:3028589-Rhodomonas_salina.2
MGACTRADAAKGRLVLGAVLLVSFAGQCVSSPPPSINLKAPSRTEAKGTAAAKAAVSAGKAATTLKKGGQKLYDDSMSDSYDVPRYPTALCPRYAVSVLTDGATSFTEAHNRMHFPQAEVAPPPVVELKRRDVRS